jgi:ATP diphosphatase
MRRGSRRNWATVFALANVARKLKLNPEIALRQGNAKFIKRFTELEAGLEAEGKKLGAATLEEMDAVWERVKT